MKLSLAPLLLLASACVNENVPAVFVGGAPPAKQPASAAVTVTNAVAASRPSIWDTTPAFGAGMEKPIPLGEGSKVPAVVDAFVHSLARKPGRLIFQVVIKDDGTVSDCRVVKALEGFRQKREACSELLTWHFTPAKRDGEPLTVTYHVAFTLREDPDSKWSLW